MALPVFGAMHGETNISRNICRSWQSLRPRLISPPNQPLLSRADHRRQRRVSGAFTGSDDVAAAMVGQSRFPIVARAVASTTDFNLRIAIAPAFPIRVCRTGSPDTPTRRG